MQLSTVFRKILIYFKEIANFHFFGSFRSKGRYTTLIGALCEIMQGVT